MHRARHRAYTARLADARRAVVGRLLSLCCSLLARAGRCRWAADGRAGVPCDVRAVPCEWRLFTYTLTILEVL